MYCVNCGKQLDEGVNFCAHCGAPRGAAPNMKTSQGNEDAGKLPLEKELLNKTKGIASNLAEKMNVMSGGDGSVELRFKDFFSNVFVKHTQDEADEIFICGSKSTTPEPESISTEWPKPWLYSRVALAMGLTYLFLLACYQMFDNDNALPGLMVVGSFVVPASLVVFFFEVNAPRNVSFASVLSIFFVGGAASLVVTLILFEVVPLGEMDFAGAILVGIIEEVGKLIIVALYIKHKRGNNYILNGLLYGAAVGAGFAAFESAGYAYRYGVMEGTDSMLDVIYTRGILSPGGHIVWAAISGAAIMIVKKDQDFSWGMLTKRDFLMIFIWPVAMHAVWDMPISTYAIASVPLHIVLLIVVAWIMIVVMLNRGLEQINRLQTATADFAPGAEGDTSKKKGRRKKSVERKKV